MRTLLIIFFFQIVQSSSDNQSKGCIANGEQCSVERECWKHFLVISKCANPNTDPIMRQRCENKTRITTKHETILHIPVYTNWVYKNMFCALCNGERNYKFAEIRCENKVKVEHCSSRTNIMFKVPKKVYQKCVNKTKKHCPGKLERMLTSYCHVKKWFSNSKSKFACVNCNKFRNDPVIISGVIDFNLWCNKGCQVKVEEYRKVKNKSNPTDQKTNLNNQYQNIVLVVLKSFSILSLLLLLVVYSQMKEVQKTSSRTTMSLVVSLLFLTVINTVYMITTYNSFTFCVTVSILLQYSFLSSFFWLSIFAVDVYRSITSLNVNEITNKVSNSNRRLIVYIFIGFGSPITFCIAAILIQIYDEKNVLNANFGEPNCFINRLVGGLVWVFIPICLCLGVNIVISACLFRFLYLSKSDTNRTIGNGKKKRNTVMLFVKISILFGVAWIPGFAGVFINSEILKTIGGFCSSLHGILFSICFFSGMKVRKTAYNIMTRSSSTILGNRNIKRPSS